MIAKDKITEINFAYSMNLARVLMCKCKIVRFYTLLKGYIDIFAFQFLSW